jgi:hypothetical protein
MSHDGSPGSGTTGESVDVGELLDLIALIDGENERLRQRHLELLRWMEEAVTAQVACERRCGELERQVAAVEAEIDAIHGTVTWRVLAPIRQVYARARRRIAHV